MRLTTKIFIGFLFFILSLTLMFFLYLRFVADGKPQRYSNGYFLDKELVSVDIPTTSYIYIAPMVLLEKSTDKYVSLHGDIVLQPETLHKGKMKINQRLQSYLKTSLRGDTLVIELDPEKVGQINSDKETQYFPYQLSSAQIHLPVSGSLHLLSQMDGLNLRAKGLDVDTLSIEMNKGRFDLTNSKIKYLNTRRKGGNYQDEYVSKNNSIGTYVLDLRNIYPHSLKLSNDSIHIFNLYGAGRTDSYSIPSSMKINTLNWYPRKKDKPLKVEVSDSLSVKFMK